MINYGYEYIYAQAEVARAAKLARLRVINAPPESECSGAELRFGGMREYESLRNYGGHGLIGDPIVFESVRRAGQLPPDDDNVFGFCGICASNVET